MSTKIDTKRPKNVPKLRFPGFKGAWEEKRLGDMTTINQGLQIPISERHLKKIDGSYFYITNEFLKENSKKQYFIKNPPESVLCNEEDLLMTRTGNTGLVVTGVKGAFHNNFFKIKYDKEICSKWFLYRFLIFRKTQNIILRLAGTSTIPDLNHGDFYKIKIILPTLPEQQKIANFLSTVDDWINNLKSQKKALEDYINGLMQRLFPAVGEKNPKLRFAGFKDEWEEKRLGEVGSLLKGKGISKSDISKNGKYKCIRYGELYTRYNEFIYDVISKTNISKRVSVVCEKNDILIPSSGETPIAIATASCVLTTNVLIGGDINILRLNKGHNGIFFSYYLSCNHTARIIAKMAQGNAVVHLYNSHLRTLRVPLPTFAEQQKIANFLTSFDNLITAKQSQISQAEEWKKGLMQGLFV